MSQLLGIAAACAVAAAFGSIMLLRAVRRQERMATRLLAVRAGGMEQEASGDSSLLRIVARIGTALARSGLLSAATLAQLEQTLRSAGLRGANGLGLFVGSKMLLLALLPVLAWLALRHSAMAPVWHSIAMGVAAVAGLLGPDYVVRSRRQAYLQRLEIGLPDALDMMVICTEAGLGLEPALLRVATEIGPSHPAVAEELAQTANELHLIADRRQALVNMGERTGLETLKRLGATLIQTLHYGTPLSQALRTLSTEMRGETLVRFESRAARLPVLLTLPMIIFILPTVFIIVGGPAMLSVLAATH